MRITLILLWIVILPGLNSIVSSFDSISEDVPLDHFQLRADEQDDIVYFSVDAPKEEDGQENPNPLVEEVHIGSVTNWSTLLLSARLNNHSIRLNISNSVPTNYIFQSCDEVIWKSDRPIKSVVVDFSQPWISHLLEFASRCNHQNQLFYSASTEYSSLTTNISDPQVHLFQHETTQIPKEKDTGSNWININEQRFDVRLNGWIAEALHSNGTQQMQIFPRCLKVKTQLQMSKCGFLFFPTFIVRPEKDFGVDEDLLNAFNMVKHTHCSNETEDDISFELLAKDLPLDSRACLIFHIEETPSAIAVFIDDVFYFIKSFKSYGNISLSPALTFILTFFLTLILLVLLFLLTFCLLNKKKRAYTVNPETGRFHHHHVFKQNVKFLTVDEKN